MHDLNAEIAIDIFRSLTADHHQECEKKIVIIYHQTPILCLFHEKGIDAEISYHTIWLRFSSHFGNNMLLTETYLELQQLTQFRYLSKI